MKIVNLEIGKEYKNKSEVCELLGVKKAVGGRNAKLQDAEFARYFKLEKTTGHKVKVIEIYSEPKEKIEKRGKSKGSRNNYKGIYAEYIDVLLLQYLQKEELKLKDTCKIYTTNNKIAEATGIVNCNYRTALNNQGKFYNTIKEDFNIRTNTYCMFDSFNIIKTKIREIIKASLDRLQKLGKLDYEMCYFIYGAYSIEIPTKEELEVINISEKYTMEEMKIENKKEIDGNIKLSKEFNKKVLKKVQEKFNYIENIFKGYTIIINENFELKSDVEIKELMTKLNALVINTLKERTQKIQKNTIKKEGLENWLGSRSPFWNFWVFDRMSTKYIEHCYNFIEILCNIKAKNIVDKIKNCNNKKITSGLTNEQKEEQKDKILIELVNNADKEIRALSY